MSQYIENILAFLADTWKVWLILTIVVLAGYSLWWYLFEQRSYRAEDNEPQVRHGRLGYWQNLGDHLKDDHKITETGR